MRHTEVIAEIGNTHEGSLGLAKAFARTAADCGVDRVKFQTHIFEAESLADAPNPPYFKGESRKEYFDRTGFSLAQWRELRRFCEEDCGVAFMSSPFSVEAVALLEQVGVDAYKVASGEVSNLPLLEKLVATGKKIYLSSGMSSWEEVSRAVDVLRRGGGELILMQCTSDYPCPPENAGLNLIAAMRERYGLPVGFSDHTAGIAVPVAAVTLGACAVEKHFTLSKRMYGPDARFSLTPEEMADLVAAIRDVDAALSFDMDKDAKAQGLTEMKQTFEKSVVAARDLAAGTVLAMEDLAFKKPGTGIPAADYRLLLGRRLAETVGRDRFLRFEMLRER